MINPKEFMELVQSHDAIPSALENGIKNVPPWSVTGVYFEACNCELICPCYTGGEPSYDVCDSNGTWHVKKGYYGGVSLDGLNVAVALRCVGHMRENPWKCWFYIDSRTTDKQYEALAKIFSAQAGGSIGKFFRNLWDIQNVERAYIEVELNGWEHRSSIKDKFLMAIGRLAPEVGAVLCRIPNTPGMGAYSEENWYKGRTLEFNHKGKNALTTTFEYNSDQ